YLIDATTVIDCLHTFCKSCLLTYFEEEDNCCPSCEQLIHQSHPSHYVAFDRTMQDIVYKLVPGYYVKYNHNIAEVFAKLRTAGVCDGSEHVITLSEGNVFTSTPCETFVSSFSQLCYQPKRAADLPKPNRSIVRLSGMATVNTLKRYLAHSLWSNMSRYNELDLFCNDELMGRDFSMRFIHLTRCRNKLKDEPLKLVYRYHIDF
ncbi:hypothetical protein Angca_002260, partial [Angiostrongylus cantonensis]